MPPKKQKNFQDELSDALRKRREQGMGTGFTSTEEEEEEEDEYYESDFEEEDVVTPKEISPPKPKSRTVRAKSPAKTKSKDKFDFLAESDDDDILGGGGSLFLKDSTKASGQPSRQKEVFDPLGATFRDSKKLQQHSRKALEEDAETDDDDPLLALLKSSDKKAATMPSQRPKTPERLRSPGAKGRPVTPERKKEISATTGRPKSPWDHKESQRDDVNALFGSKKQSSKHATDEVLQRSKSPTEYRGGDVLKERRSADRSKTPPRRSLSPKLEKQPSALESILSSVKGAETHEKQHGKLKSTEAVKSQSIVDFLLDDAPKSDDSPKPVPRRRTRKTSQDSQSQQDSLSRPSSSGSRRDKERVRSPKGGERSKRGSSRSPSPGAGLRSSGGKTSSPFPELAGLDKSTRRSTKSPPLGDMQGYEKATFGADPFAVGSDLAPMRSGSPSLGGTYASEHVPATLSGSLGLGNDRGTLSAFPPPVQQPMSGTFPGIRQPRRDDFGAMSEQKQSEADADDLLALFDRTMKTGGPVQAVVETPPQPKAAPKTAAEKISEKNAEHAAEKQLRQTSQHQLFDDVIESVSKHNEKLHSKEEIAAEESLKTKTRPKSSRKSYRTPPVNYGGLGSLTALKDLKKKGHETPSEDTLSGGGDLRKAAYLEWLAKREKETKKKKHEEEAKIKEEEEKKQKELDDKATENLIVRRKWEEVKKEQEKDKLRVKRAQERHKQKEEEEKEKQKEKSTKMAERRREQMLKSARIKKQEELKKEREDVRKKRKDERMRKEDNEKALDKWMEKRSSKWEEDRKKEQKEKRKQVREERYEKDQAAKEAEERYNTWRERKDNQLKATMREKKMKERRSRYQEEEDVENILPPWSPPNKVIPRQR